ncbi:FAD/NAD(P)-binding domain-containing protein [Sparassis latifolia]
MKVAVVGSGVSGLAATWLLNEYTDHEVHLYEADSRPGGHANTVSFTIPGKEPVDVDTGFIVFNPDTYPNFLRFLRQYPPLRERIRETCMTFSVSRDAGAFEWAGTSLRAIFCQRSRLLDPRMWRLLYDVVRFNACAPRLLVERNRRRGDSYTEELSIGEYLRKEGYSNSFMDNYLIPMTAAIWSTPPDKCALDFPARTLIQFMHNHHLLQIISKPAWLTLEGGSQTYVKQILASLPASQLHLSTPVASVTSNPTDVNSSDGAGPLYSVEITTSSDERKTYDHVILACHADTSLAILRAGGGLTPDEERSLGAFGWSKNEAVLHCDERLMPIRRAAWSCWNYLTKSEQDSAGRTKANIDDVSLTYWMNDLQHISMERHGPVFVTLNPPFEPHPKQVVGWYQYDHPILGTEAVRAQEEMALIQHTRGISYAGAWLKYGFHEDGFTSGLRAAAALRKTTGDATGAGAPFKIYDADRSPGRSAVLLAGLFDAFEASGLRAVLGIFLSWCLTLLRTIFSLAGFRLSSLNAELREERRKVQ